MSGLSFCQDANQSLGAKTRIVVKETPNFGYYDQLFERLVNAGILFEKEGINTSSSSKDVGPLLLKLFEEFKVGPDSNDRKKQRVFIWAFQEYLGREITF